MISGRSGGSGKYSYQETHDGAYSVLVAHMPEDAYEVRMVFKSNGETNIPTVKIPERAALLLWSSLNRMAEDLGWDDRMPSERIADAVSKQELEKQ